MIRRVKQKSTIVIIIAIFILITGGCSVKQESSNVQVPAAVPPPTAKGADVNQYIIDAVLDTADKVLTAEQQVIYVNNDDVELSELYFHIYTNAFRKQETAPFLFDDFSRAYSRGFKPGYTEIEAIELSKGQSRKALEYSLQGVGETILKIKLPEPLKPEDSINLRFKYKVIIPPAGERFGYGDSNINMGNWYPVAAVYDDEGWNLDKYYSIGDPFYSDVSDYTVNIKAPEEYIIAASGSLAEEKIEGGYKNWKFQGSKMRDFAFVASNSFRVTEDKVGNTVVKSYYYKGHEKRGKEALDIGKRSIEIFNSAYGEYPYPTYSIVETEFPSGMEYPGLVYISTKYYDNDSNANIFMYTTVHETAHQWWYGVVGNDQIDEAWLDEGFATYSEGIFTEMEYGEGNGDLYYKYLEESAKEDIRSKAYDGVILKPLSRYENWNDYGPAVYTGGAALLNEIRKQVGDQAFFIIMQAYYDEYSFKNATTEDFLRICEEVGNTEFDDLFHKHLSSVK
ncbi:MAG TPA: M1 family metallopeptidase [Bacillota bacterium]|mgnify:FL=1|nr:M1 family metallopeptidase [Bacillota bacterium]